MLLQRDYDPYDTFALLIPFLTPLYYRHSTPAIEV